MYRPMRDNEKRNDYFRELVINEGIAIEDHYIEMKYGKSKFATVCDIVRFINDPTFDNALNIGISKLISFGVTRATQSFFMARLAAAGVSSGPAGMSIVILTTALSFAIEKILENRGFNLFGFLSSGNYIDFGPVWKLYLVPVKKPSDWDEGGPGGIEFRGIEPIQFFNSIENVLSQKVHIFFETKFNEDVKNAFNSICLPEFRGKRIQEYFETIMREVSDGLDVTSQLPFISLQFNNNHQLYSVMPSYYKQTLIGNVLTFLDYFLKGFVNGGFFSIEFVHEWIKKPPHQRTTDLKLLNSNLIDVRKVLKQIHIRFKSLYDMVDQDQFTNDFSSAFRIIGEMSQIDVNDDIVFPQETFSVEHDFYPSPQLQKQMEAGGPVSDKIDEILAAYHKMRDIIKKIMSKVPQFRGFFVILDMITFALLYHTSLSSIGKKAKTPNAFQVTNKGKEYVNIIPEVFPPLPVLEQTKVTVEISLGEIIESLKTINLENEIKKILIDEQPQYSETFINQMKPKIIGLYRKKVSLKMGEDFKLYDDDDIDVENVEKKIYFGIIIILPIHIKILIYQFLIDLSEQLHRYDPNENAIPEEFENMTYKQIENKCRECIDKIKNCSQRKINELNRLISEKQNEIQNITNSLNTAQRNNNHNDVRKYTNDLDQAKNELSSLSNDNNFYIIDSASFLLRDTLMSAFSEIPEHFYKYKDMLNLSYSKKIDICIWKPRIKENNENSEIIGGCLVNVNKTPKYRSNPAPTKTTLEIHSFIKSRKAEDEFIECSDNSSGFVISLDVIPSYLDGTLLSCSRFNDFFKNNNLGINNLDVSHFAANSCFINILNQLSESQCKQETLDKITPAMIACSKGNVVSINTLIQKKADFGLAPPNGISPFLSAVMNDNYDAAMYLLLDDHAKIGDLNQTNETGKTPLFWAIQYDHLDIIKLLLDKKASIKATLKKNGMTPVHYACYQNKPEILFLLDNADDSFKYAQTEAGYSPLQISIAHSIRCANFIIDNKKEKLSINDPRGFSLYDIAILNGEYEITKKLPKSGMLINALEKYQNSGGSKDVEFNELCQALGTGDSYIAETLFDNWQEVSGKKPLTQAQAKKLIDRACFGRCPEFVELLSRVINLKDYPDLIINVAKNGLEDWIVEIQKYGGDVMCEINHSTIFDIAVENSDFRLLARAFDVIDPVPQNILKRIIKRSIEINDIYTMSVISNVMKFKKIYGLLSPSDLIFQNTSPLAFQIYKQNLDKNIDIKLSDFITVISSKLLLFLLENHQFKENDLVSACQKALKNNRNYNAYLIVDENKSIIEKVSKGPLCNQVKKLTEQNKNEALNQLIEVNKNILLPNEKKIQQFKNILANIFDLTDKTFAISVGRNINCLWILEALPEWCLKGFFFSNEAFEDVDIETLFRELYSKFETIYKPDIKKVVLMFMNSLKQLDFDDLDRKGYGNEFISSLIKVMELHCSVAVDDDENTIFHIVSRFKKINEENIKLMVDKIKSSKLSLLNSRNRFGETILMKLASSGNYIAFNEIDKLEPNLKYRDIYGDNVIHKLINGSNASNDNIFQLISEIIKKYPEMILQKNRKGKSPFMAAAKKGYKGIVGLMSTFYPINVLDSGNEKSIIHLAAKYNNAETIRYIVQYLHIDVNIKSKDGLTPLHYAAMKSCVSAFNELLKLGGNPLILNNDEEKSSIDYALKFGSPEMIENVIKTASFNYSLSSPEILVNLVSNPAGYKTFCTYISYFDKSAFHSCDLQGNNLISIACSSNNRKFVSDLLVFGCDPEKRSFIGYNSIHACAESCSIGCSTLILDYIHAIKGDEGIKNILNEPDVYGNIPLHISAKKGFSGFVTHLLSACKDQDITKENNLKHSPLTESIISENYEVAGIIAGFITNVLKKSEQTLRKSITPELLARYGEITKYDEFISGFQLAKQIQEIEYTKIQKTKSLDKPKASYPNPSKDDEFMSILDKSKISIPNELNDQCTRIINNYNFQYIIALVLNFEGAESIKAIFNYIIKINSPRIRDITCLVLLPKLQTASNIIKLLKMILQIDSLNIIFPHPLFAWIENGLISVAETEHNPDLLITKVQKVVDLIIFINKYEELKSIIQYPVLPAPIHVISETIGRFVDEKYKKVQLKFINYMKASMTWNETPSLSIDFSNNIECNQSILFDYVLEKKFGIDIIERAIEITINLSQNRILSDQNREIILKKCKAIIEKDRSVADEEMLKIQIGAWETNILAIIQSYGIVYLRKILLVIPDKSLEQANRTLVAIAKICDPEIATRNLIRKGPDVLENKAEEMEKKRFVESRNLEEVIEAFCSGSGEFVPYKFAFDGTPVVKLSSRELNNLRSFGQLVEAKRNYISISDMAHQFGKAFRDEPTILNAAKLVGLVRSVIREVFNVNPFIVQCLAVGGLLFHRIDKKIRPQLKGRIAQVATGEGKSIIIAMLASCIALTGNTVDIISSSIYLAQRDAEKFKIFYEKLGLSCGCILENQKNDFDFHILYSTNTEYEFALLREGVKGKTENETTLLYENVKRHRPYMTAIVDEVDNLFIDTATNSARIAERGNSNQSWIFKPIWEEVCHNNYNKKSIREKMRKVAHNDEQMKILNEMSDFKLGRLIDRAMTAKQMKKDVNYVIGQNKQTKEKEIQIVDTENTGRIKYGSRWSNGLHEFVELKEGLPNDKMSYTVASISHPSYFELYDEIFGLTGTLGEEAERNEIKQIYHVDTFDVPPNRKCLRKREKTLIVKTDEKKINIIINKIKEIKKMNRPILVIVLTIEESKRMSDLLRMEKIDHFVLNDQQQQDEDFIVDRAGKPGAVTIATNTAGRGTDIRVDKQALKNGGLYTLITFFPANLRVECQALGRSGRQGQPGSCQIIYSDERLGNDDTTSPTKDEVLQCAYELRTLRIQEQSNSRMKGFENERFLFSILKIYFVYIRALRTFLEMPETESLLKASHLDMKDILNQLKDSWMLYFSSISSGDDEVTPSFNEFLKRWNFNEKYPTLSVQFEPVFNSLLNAEKMSRSHEKPEEEKPPKKEKIPTKVVHEKAMRFPSDPEKPPPVVTYVDEKKKKRRVHIKPPKIIAEISSDSGPVSSPASTVSIDIPEKVNIKFIFDSQFRSFVEEIDTETQIGQIAKNIVEKYKIKEKVAIQYDDDDGTKVTVATDVKVGDILDDMKKTEPSGETKYILYIKIIYKGKRSKKSFMPSISPVTDS